MIDKYYKLHWLNRYNNGCQLIYMNDKTYRLECVNFVGSLIYLLDDNKNRKLIQTNEPEFDSLKLLLKPTKLFYKLYCRINSHIHEMSILDKYAIDIPSEYYTTIIYNK